MMKSYKDYMNEIGQDELYDRLVAYGLFSKNLPPIFDSSDFLEYCKNKKYGFECKEYRYAVCYVTRNVNIPRAIGIPTPMSFERLCRTLRDNWDEIKKHFKDCTTSNNYRVSRIHLKKRSGTMSLFDMNYDTHGDNPELDLSMGKRYIVRTDISQCFPSIYSHAIPWALVGKSTSKNNRSERLWYNQIDKMVRLSTCGETHGILIGPHASNLISEIILCKIDKTLSKNWNYVRYIDDYEYYAETEDDARQFVFHLSSTLHEYGLLLNNKKTVIEKLPVTEVKNWKAEIKAILANIENEKGIVDYNGANYYIEKCIGLMRINDDNASVLAYGTKSLSSKTLSSSARNYIIKKSISLAMLYPYLASFLDDMILSHYTIEDNLLQRYLEQLYKEYISENNFSAASYIIQLSLKYNITLNNLDIDEIIIKNDCILLLCSLLYSRRYSISEFIKKLKVAARDLQSQGDLEEYWPFVYECLPATDLHRDWKNLKNNKISFIKSEYRT